MEECKTRGQPVLVGTTSIEKSEQLAEMLRKEGWEQHDFSDPNAFAALYSGDDGADKTKVFAMLNARYHEQEAYIVSQAGVPGAITIATNMAGRGTDIQLGGNADMRIRQELRRRGLAARARPARDAIRTGGGSRRRRLRPAGCSCSAPSATRAGASTTSCAAAPAARAIPGAPSSSSRSKTT